jgi:hypothetical protein
MAYEIPNRVLASSVALQLSRRFAKAGLVAG